MAALCTSEEVVGLLRQLVAQHSHGPRHAVDAYVDLISSDPLLHIRIRELRERAFAAARRRAPPPRRARDHGAAESVEDSPRGRAASSARRASTHVSS